MRRSMWVGAAMVLLGCGDKAAPNSASVGAGSSSVPLEAAVVEVMPSVLDGAYTLPSSSQPVALGADVAVAVMAPDGTARIGRVSPAAPLTSTSLAAMPVVTEAIIAALQRVAAPSVPSNDAAQVGMLGTAMPTVELAVVAEPIGATTGLLVVHGGRAARDLASLVGSAPTGTPPMALAVAGGQGAAAWGLRMQATGGTTPVPIGETVALRLGAGRVTTTPGVATGAASAAPPIDETLATFAGRAAAIAPPATHVRLELEPDATVGQLVVIVDGLVAAGHRTVTIGATGSFVDLGSFFGTLKAGIASDNPFGTDFGTIDTIADAGDGIGRISIGRIGSGSSGWGPRSSSMAWGKPTVTGKGFPVEIVNRYMKRNALRLAYCYETELKARPTLAGAATLTFVITTDGTVATAASKGFDATVDACLAKVVFAIEFPKPPSLVKVKFPLRFKAAKTP